MGDSGERLIVTRLDRQEAHAVNVPSQFSGVLHRQELAVAGQEAGTDLTGVFFPAGVRTLPHTHSVDQLLYAVSGQGVVATKLETRLLEEGSWVIIPAGTWHWHGARQDSAFLQVAIKWGGQTEWLPETTDWRDARL